MKTTVDGTIESILLGPQPQHLTYDFAGGQATVAVP